MAANPRLAGTSTATLPTPQNLHLPSGVEIHYIEAGQGTPLVFVHGAMGDYTSWRPQWPAFSSRYRALSYSRRYSVPNRNKGIASPHHSALVEAEDLAALLQAWQATPAILVGSSYGAYTALALALQQPQWVQALVIAEPPMLRWADRTPGGREVREAFERDVIRPAEAAFMADDWERAVTLLTGGIVGATDGPAVPPAAMQQRMQNALAIRMLSQSSDQFPMLSPEAIAAFDKPTLLIAGEHTPPIHDVVYRALCAVMTQAEQVRIPQAGHGAYRDNPAVFNRVVLDFLARVQTS